MGFIMWWSSAAVYRYRNDQRQCWQLGKQVTCIEAAKRILSPAFDEEFSALATKELQSKGVRILTEQKAVAITGGSCVTGVQTDQELIDADLVVIAAGVRPATEFLADTGIERAANGAIVVDRQMRASLPDVWAAGDCALVYDCIKNRNVFLPLGTVANKCGRIAGTNICGGNEEYIGALSSAAIKVCDLEMGRTGMGEADAKEAGYEIGTVVVNTASHPRYYPNPTPITIKVIYDKQSKRILGAQLAGQKGAALRTDVFAVAIQAGMTTKTLGMADFIYAPPFAGVWDAIHIACNAAK